MNYFIYSAEVLGVIGGGYVGYKNGNKFKDYLLNQSTFLNDKYKSSILPVIKNNKIINEQLLFNLIGMCGGMSFSWYMNCWWGVIPVSLFQITYDHPEIFKK